MTDRLGEDRASAQDTLPTRDDDRDLVVVERGGGGGGNTLERQAERAGPAPELQREDGRRRWPEKDQLGGATVDVEDRGPYRPEGKAADRASRLPGAGNPDDEQLLGLEPERAGELGTQQICPDDAQHNEADPTPPSVHARGPSLA